MKTYGPYNGASSPALVPGTAIQIIVDPATTNIQVQNDSPYRLYIQFDGSRPVATSASGSNYSGVAGPWGHPVIPVNIGGTNQGGMTFYGVVWIMPVSVNSQLATTGATSTLAEVHLDAYTADETPPQSWAMPRQQDATSQQRVITVPMSLGAGGVQTGRITTPAAGASTNLYAGFVVTALLGAGNTLAFFVYSVYITPGYNPPGVGGMDVSILVDVQNAANVSIGFPWPQEFIRANLTWNTGGQVTTILWPPSPWPAAFAVPLSNLNIDHIALVLKNQGSTNAPAQCDFTIAAALGPTGTNNTVQIPGPIGLPSNPINSTL